MSYPHVISVDTTSVQILCTLIIHYMFRHFVHHKVCTFQCWPYCSSLVLGSVYSGYILCCLFAILECKATICVLIKLFNININL
jgi:hypothetical protein